MDAIHINVPWITSGEEGSRTSSTLLVHDLPAQTLVPLTQVCKRGHAADQRRTHPPSTLEEDSGTALRHEIDPGVRTQGMQGPSLTANP